MKRIPTTTLCIAVFLTGCAKYPVNPPLRRVSLSEGYRYSNLKDSGIAAGAKENFVILTFSGGGIRAAALAYGVLAKLDAARIGPGRTLLDEVDVISSVSAGSFTAAYYGLFGKERLFRRFKTDVLYRDITTQLLLRLLAPWNWPRLLSPDFGRSDLVDEYYDRHIFEGRTFASMPLRRPFIIINSTDLSLGSQFAFIQEDFDRLCSDLSAVHVSRAVTASSAFPQIFSPLTFKNYPKSECSYTTPKWVLDGLKDPHTAPDRYQRASDWISYENVARRPFIHLSDGGLADNIGLRGPELAITTNESSWSILGMINEGLIGRLAVIVVDGKPTKPPVMDRSASPPGLRAVLSAAETNPMENYSADTIEQLRQRFAEWDRAVSHFNERRRDCDQVTAHMCTATQSRTPAEIQRREQCYAEFGAADSQRPPYPELYEIHVRLEAIQDASLRKRLAEEPTTLQLPHADVDLLIKAGGALLEQSPQYRKLVADLRDSAGWTPPRKLCATGIVTAAAARPSVSPTPASR